ncbi:MAG TPA: HAD hydrolase-like protein [Acidimicrobiales bacterium]|nr:HAD hydrolase-like protein [Acidimicrobiales bacterium]
MTWVLDLDGVVWLADEPIPGAAGAVAALRDRGERVVFATNFSGPLVAEHEAKLAAMGIPAEGDVLTSSMAAARLVEPEERVLIVGGPGIVEAVTARGAEPVAAGADGNGDVDVVAVGLTQAFDYDMMRVAAGAVRRGARLLGTNDDATFPTPDGPVPGAGALLASVAYASGVTPVVAGKPHPPMADLVRAVGGPEGTVVGDRPDTDGALARQLGYRFALVLTGVTHPDDLPVAPEPDEVADSLAALVARGQ